MTAEDKEYFDKHFTSLNKKIIDLDNRLYNELSLTEKIRIEHKVDVMYSDVTAILGIVEDLKKHECLPEIKIYHKGKYDKSKRWNFFKKLQVQEELT